jgi:hypothetical protein
MIDWDRVQQFAVLGCILNAGGVSMIDWDRVQQFAVLGWEIF